MTEQGIIGVIGGMSPQAGLDLVEKITAQTRASTDQEHVPVALLSYPGRIHGRSAFLSGRQQENPGYAIAEIARQLDGLGAVVAGIASNEAHAPAIFDVVTERLRADGCRLRVLHMIQETVRYVKAAASGARRIGVLSTLAVYRLRLYADELEAAGYETILPDEAVQESIVNRTIFDPAYDIKAHAHPVSLIARQSLLNAIDHLKQKGADAVILGCIELPLAIPEADVASVEIFDPNRILARALLRETYPEKLRG